MKSVLLYFRLIPWLPFAAVAAEADTAVSDAVHRGTALVARAATNWQQHKSCFSCHHQTLPLLALIESDRAGRPLDAGWVKSQADTTHKYFAERIADLDEGEHVPGGSTTVGYGLWALSLAKRPPDQTTKAMVTYLLKIQGVARLQGRVPSDLTRVASGRWITSCRRPPLQGSDVADTVLALVGMEQFATPEQRPSLAKARVAADRWLAQTPLLSQEDRIWRLWGMHRLGGDTAVMESVRADILRTQRNDGGWSQTNGLPSDAFSTGQTLFVLRQTGLPADAPVVLRARDFLLKTRQADGSWLVESRLKTKAQPFFENGDPHGMHQFLSTAATAWATAALAQLAP